MNTDTAAIRKILEQYALSINAGDFDSWLALWTDNGTAMPPDAPVCIGKERFQNEIKPDFEVLDMAMVILSIEDVKVYGDFGLTRCKYSLSVTPKAGGETIDVMPEGKALTLMKDNPMELGKLPMIATTPASPPIQLEPNLIEYRIMAQSRD